VRLRSRGEGVVTLVFAALVLSNAFGAHRAFFDAWGYPGLVALYLGWIVVFALAWWRVRYRVFNPQESP
jgi:hypothetical protein